ncbi:TPA: hypothetical protein HH898_005273 [Escherichia coli]|nr:hypothetical protein [Escherichia coli]HAH5009842.1 hypothetical protein [Escherichia coli]HAH5963505.1 hypothetical protein [Escherichia coli]
MICAVFILLFLMTHRDMSYPASVLFTSYETTITQSAWRRLFWPVL